VNSRLMVVVGVLAVAAIVGGIGIGYALYQGNTYSEGNTSDIVKNSVDIWADKGSGYEPLDTSILMPEFEQGQTVTIDGYRLVLTDGGSVYLTCNMGDAASWYLINSMSITINEATYNFGVGQVNSVKTTGLPTSAIALTTGGTTFEADGETLVYYDFTITITFANIDIHQDPNWERLSSFDGSNFEFAFIASQQ